MYVVIVFFILLTPFDYCTNTTFPIDHKLVSMIKLLGRKYIYQDAMQKHFVLYKWHKDVQLASRLKLPY